MKPYADKLSKHVKNNSESHVAEQQQGDASIAQFSDNRATAVAQRQLINAINNSPKQIAQRRLLQDSFQEGLDRSQSLLTAQFKGEAKPNNFGLPDKLKAGIEGLSDYSMDDVKVHYNSAKPSQLQAHAFAQETDIHIAPGQERHLSHEAWHVVQQKQQRVKPTTQMKGGVNVNDDVELDKEADLMGEKAATQSLTQQSELNPTNHGGQNVEPSQHTSQLISWTQSSTGTTVQLISEVGAKQQLIDGGYLANFLGSFITRHVSLTKNSNLAAAEVHAGRSAPPRTNTVIEDAGALKNSLAGGDWTSRGGGAWDITASGPIALQDTRRRNDAIQAKEAEPDLITYGDDEPEMFTVESRVVTSMSGVSEDELKIALDAAGSYPTSGKGLSGKRRNYRQKLINSVNAQRRQKYSNDRLVWVKANFSHIGGTALDGAITSESDVEGIATRTETVKVSMNAAGNIFHFDGYD